MELLRVLIDALYWLLHSDLYRLCCSRLHGSQGLASSWTRGSAVPRPRGVWIKLAFEVH